MKILLVGEYSRLHNSLKEGLLTLGHDVTLIGTPDGFKGFPVDHDYSARLLTKLWLKPLVKAIRKVTSINLIKIENAIRFNKTISNLGDFEIIQLISENPIKTSSSLEIKLLKKLLKKSGKSFLLSCGTDYVSVKFALNKKYKYSILTPLHENSTLKKQYQFVLQYISKEHQKLHQFIYQNIKGVIASDMDYHLPLLEYKNYLGLIPNPINTDKIEYIPLNIDSKIIIFHGINKGNYIKKGNRFFEEALNYIDDKYADKITIINTENIPYKDYIKLYDSAHIVLDQVYAYDQGYNALEAMAKGKVVFTGAEQEWLDYYNLKENTVVINALPDAKHIAKNLEWLILNPQRILDISKNARSFIEKEHNYKKIAKLYRDIWQQF